MLFQVVPKETTDLVTLLASKHPDAAVRDLANAYLILAARFNRHLIFMDEFMQKTSFESNFNAADAIRRLDIEASK